MRLHRDQIKLAYLLSLVTGAVVLMSATALAPKRELIVPSDGVVTIAGNLYSVDFVPGLTGPVTGSTGLALQPVSSEVLCPVDIQSGLIKVDAGMLAVQQAKALIHETVHIAQTCDHRDLILDERIAQDVADLMSGAEGRFVLQELSQ